MILAISADFLVTELLRASFGPAEICLVRDAFAALDQMTESISAIILDLSLPAANGVALIHQLASDSRLNGVPLVLLAEDLPPFDQAIYNVRRVLRPAELTPAKLRQAVLDA